MANPRKFSEKIALHNQKQAEETAEFEKIMREVSNVTSKVVTQSVNVSLAPTTNLGAFKGGSLPNVSEQNRKQQTNKTQAGIVDASKKPDEITLLQFGLGAPQNSQINDGSQQRNANSQNSPVYRESRGRSVGVGPMRRPGDRKIDTSPYSSGNVAYLSPPNEWRRTSSDSAIHQSLSQNQDNHHSHAHGSHSPLPTSPVAQRRVMNTSSNIDIKSYGNEQSQFALSLQDNNRPRSSCGRLPGISIYPSAHDNSVQIPIGNNTGSLPDLTSVHFPSPLHTPLDQEHDHSSSPYSTSPVTTSPATLSPTSIPTRHPNAKFGYSPIQSPGDGSAFSPVHGNTNHHYLSVPGSKFLPNMKVGAIDNSYQSPQGGQQNYAQQQQQQHQQQQQQNIYNQTNHHSPPNNVLYGSHGSLSTLAQTNLSGYRSPKGRPSPGSSPGLIGPSPNSGESNTSAPCSPASQPLGNNGQYDQFQSSEYYLNPSIQQHFEQFSLVDNPLSDFSAASPLGQNFSQYDDGNYSHLSTSNIDSLQSNQLHQQNQSPLGLSNQNMNLNNSNSLAQQSQSNQQQQQQQLSLSMSPHHQSSQNHQSQQQQQSQQQHHQQTSQCPQTPNTPTSIPEIIFTDFSSAANELTKDLFDDPLRPIDLELGAMDFAGYQMLSDPNATMIADPTIEDSFRRDLN